MVSFASSAAIDSLRDAVRSTAVERLRPLAVETDRDGCTSSAVSAVLNAITGIDRVDPARGVLDPVGFCAVAENLAWGDPAVAYAWASSRQAAYVLTSCGSSEQKSRYLSGSAGSAIIPASLMLYEGFGRGLAELATTADQDSRGWVINGEKIGVPFAGDARYSVVIARDGSGRPVAFVVDLPSADVVFAGEEDRRIALAGLPFASSALLANLRVSDPADVLASGVLLDRALGICRLALAAVGLGLAESTTQYAAEWSANRLAFGRPLAAFQGVSFVIADLFMDIESTRVGLLNCLSMLSDRSVEFTTEDVDDLVSPIVGQVGNLLRNAAREGVELMGVHGVIADHPAERAFRSAPVLAAIDFDPLHNPLVLR